MIKVNIDIGGGDLETSGSALEVILELTQICEKVIELHAKESELEERILARNLISHIAIAERLSKSDFQSIIEAVERKRACV